MELSPQDGPESNSDALSQMQGFPNLDTSVFWPVATDEPRSLPDFLPFPEDVAYDFDGACAHTRGAQSLTGRIDGVRSAYALSDYTMTQDAQPPPPSYSSLGLQGSVLSHLPLHTKTVGSAVETPLLQNG